jgi:hypothetical protein
MLREDSKLSLAELNARLRDFGLRRVPAEQQQMASVEVGAVPVNGLMVTQLNAQLLGGARGWLSITTLLFALGALVLVVACVNYANLSTARAARRAREIGLRKVIGASRGQVVVQYLFEAGLLTATALAVAVVAVQLIAPVVANALGIDMRSVVPALGSGCSSRCSGVTLLGGAYPALVLSRVRPIEALRLGRMRIGPRFASTLLVGAQFAAASFLLIAVIVMYSQNAELRRTGLGTTADPYVVINNFGRVTGVDNNVLRGARCRRWLHRDSARPGAWRNPMVPRVAEETATRRRLPTTSARILQHAGYSRRGAACRSRAQRNADTRTGRETEHRHRSICRRSRFGSPEKRSAKSSTSRLAWAARTGEIIDAVEAGRCSCGFGTTSNAGVLGSNFTQPHVRLSPRRVRRRLESKCQGRLAPGCRSRVIWTTSSTGGRRPPASTTVFSNALFAF